RIALVGHSLGGHLASLYAALDKDRTVSAMIIAASGTPYCRSWSFPANAGILATAGIVYGVGSVLGYYPGERIAGVFGNQGRTLMREWANLARNGRFVIRGIDRDLDAALAEVTLPLLAISFEGDSWAPRRAVEHLVAKMPHARATHRRIAARELGAEK